MSIEKDDEIKCCTGKRKSARAMAIIQGKRTVAEASRQFDILPSEIEDWVNQAKAGMEGALRAKPEDVRQQYERQRTWRRFRNSNLPPAKICEFWSDGVSCRI